MKDCLKSILKIIWIIDILNIGISICGVNIAELLDVTLPLNTVFWLLMWLFVL